MFTQATSVRPIENPLLLQRLLGQLRPSHHHAHDPVVGRFRHVQRDDIDIVLRQYPRQFGKSSRPVFQENG